MNLIEGKFKWRALGSNVWQCNVAGYALEVVKEGRGYVAIINGNKCSICYNNKESAIQVCEGVAMGENNG